MQIGDLAYVLYVRDGAHNVLRNSRWQPIGGIPVGGVVEILDGPKTRNGVRYWKVFCARAWDQRTQKWTSLEGWTAEGQGDAVWLSEVLAGDVCPGTYGTHLESGHRAYVRRGRGGLNLRTAPDKDQDNVVATLPELAIVRIVWGWECADGMVWWRVVADKATPVAASFQPAHAYWVSEGQGSTYFLAPLEVPPTE